MARIVSVFCGYCLRHTKNALAFAYFEDEMAQELAKGGGGLFVAGWPKGRSGAQESFLRAANG